jgi:predicted transcriptional regulator
MPESRVGESCGASWSPEALEEDARRLAEFERTRLGVPWDEVKAWMDSWGIVNELPSPKPRKL